MKSAKHIAHRMVNVRMEEEKSKKFNQRHFQYIR